MLYVVEATTFARCLQAYKADVTSNLTEGTGKKCNEGYLLLDFKLLWWEMRGATILTEINSLIFQFDLVIQNK